MSRRTQYGGPRQYPLHSDSRPATEETRVAVYGPDIKSVYPCCSGPCRFRTTNHIPKETYDRTCAKCGTKWTVIRTTAQMGIEAAEPLRRLDRIDVLRWETTLVEIHAKNRRALLADYYAARDAKKGGV